MKSVEVITTLSEGNPGALSALARIEDKDFDRVVNFFNIYHVYGWKIYVLWNDLCSRDTNKFIQLLFAGIKDMELGLKLKIASEDDPNQRIEIDVEGILK